MVKSVYLVKPFSHEIDVIYYEHIDDQEGVTFLRDGRPFALPWVGNSGRLFLEYETAWRYLMRRLQSEWWEYANSKEPKLNRLARHLKEKIYYLRTQAPWPGVYLNTSWKSSENMGQ